MKIICHNFSKDGAIGTQEEVEVVTIDKDQYIELQKINFMRKLNQANETKDILDLISTLEREVK